MPALFYEVNMFLDILNTSKDEISKLLHTQDVLSIEDRLLKENSNRIVYCEHPSSKKYDYPIVSENRWNDDLKRNFMFQTSLPYSFYLKKYPLKNIWKLNGCGLCIDDNIVHRYAMPTGNLEANIMFLGEAPGVADGERILERVMARGPTSKFLRRACIKAGIYFESWFTNILKCALKNNKKKSDEPFENCFSFLKEEIEIINPSVIILLGRNVQQFIHSKSEMKKYNLKDLLHPSACKYKGIDEDTYASMIKEKI
jgi:uracil-DNA glycosylase family 4